MPSQESTASKFYRGVPLEEISGDQLIRDVRRNFGAVTIQQVAELIYSEGQKQGIKTCLTLFSKDLTGRERRRSD